MHQALRWSGVLAASQHSTTAPGSAGTGTGEALGAPLGDASRDNTGRPTSVLHWAKHQSSTEQHSEIRHQSPADQISALVAN
jgi:hypothetical protein